MDNAHHESEQGDESEESHEKGTSSWKRAGDCSLACRPILAGCEPESRCAVEASHGVPLDSLLFAHGETSLCRMADMVIPSNCVERSEPFSAPRCQQASHTSGRILQAALQEHFRLCVSISQINRVRAELGLSISSQRKPQAKKTQ